MALDKNAITGFAALQRVWAPMLTTAWHYSITNNPRLVSVYAPGLRKLGPHVFANNAALRAVHLGTQSPVQDPTAFTDTDAAKLTLYHPPARQRGAPSTLPETLPSAGRPAAQFPPT